MLRLRVATPPQWTETVLGDLDAFLIDHAAAERKASAAAMAFVVRYPDRTALLGPMIELAREELEHLEQVYALVAARGLQLTPDRPDPYLKPLLKLVGNGREERLLDRLLVSGIVEARGCERFGLIAAALEPGDLKEFYAEITRAEARHHGLFVRLAREYFADAVVQRRLDTLLEAEAVVVAGLEIRAALH